MSANFHFHLPDFPPQRLLDEAALSWNLRHMDESPLLEADTSPWPLVRGAVLAFLRHRLSAYDDRLRGEYNHELRDELATEIARAAYRRYPWIAKDDPRPFPEPKDDGQSQLFTELARDLARDHSTRDHLVSAIRDLKREGKLAQVAALQTALAKIERRIGHSYRILTEPKYLHDASGSSSRGYGFPHHDEQMGHYYFLDDRAVTPNRYDYLGFYCPQCDARVVRHKQPINFGQGFKMIVHSCYCTTQAAVCPPAGRHLKPLTLTEWISAEPDTTL